MWPLRRASTARASSSGDTPGRPRSRPRSCRRPGACRGAAGGPPGPAPRRSAAAESCVMSSSPSSRTTTVAPSGRTSTARLDWALRTLARSLRGRPPRRDRRAALGRAVPGLSTRFDPVHAPGAPPGRIAGWRGTSRPSVWWAWARWARHRGGVRPRGPAGGGRRADRGCPRARPRAPAPLHRPGGTPGQADRGRPGRPGRPGPLHHVDGGPRRRRPGDRGGAGAARPQAGDLRHHRQALPGRHDPGDQHLVAVRDRDLGRHHPAVNGRRHALLQPGAGAQAGRGGAHGRHRAGRGRRRLGAGPAARQDRRSSIGDRPASSRTRCCSAT